MAILEVIIPKITSGILSDVNIDNINIGDEVNVIVCGKKFTLYDKMISIIGRIIKDKVSDDISVIEEIEDDSPSIDDEDAADERDLYGADDVLNDDDDELYDDAEEEEDEVENIKKIIIDEDRDSKIKGGEFSMFENDDDAEAEEDAEEEEEDAEEDDDDMEDAEDDADEDLDFGGDDYD